MDDIFSSIFSLIPIALIIGVRVLAAKKKEADKKASENLAQYMKNIGATQSSSTALGSRPNQHSKGVPVVASVKAEPKDAAVFSAHSLVPDDDSPNKPLLRESRAALIEALAKDRSAERQQSNKARRLLQDTPSAKSVQSVVSVASFPDEGPQSVEAVFEHAIHSGGPRKQLKDLPPLQHAVVMAEILSTPLSLREGF